jgi:hypothetical protein
MQVGHAFLWEYSYKRLQSAQLMGQLGVSLTWSPFCSVKSVSAGHQNAPSGLPRPASAGVLHLRRRVPYYTAPHTAPHTNLHLNNNREALRQRKLRRRTWEKQVLSARGVQERVGRRSGYARVLRARCGGAKEEAQGFQVKPLDPLNLCLPGLHLGGSFHCPGRKPPKRAVKRPARPYKSPIQK